MMEYRLRMLLEPLLEQDFCLVECDLLLSVHTLVLLRLLLSDQMFLFARVLNLAWLAPLLANFRAECYRPDMVSCTCDSNHRVFSLHLYFKAALLRLALLLDRLHDFNTVVADAMFCIEFPEADVTTGTSYLDCVLVVLLDFALADYWFKLSFFALRTCCQVVVRSKFWYICNVAGLLGFEGGGLLWYRLEEVFEEVCGKSEFLAWGDSPLGLGKNGFHFVRVVKF